MHFNKNNYKTISEPYHLKDKFFFCIRREILVCLFLISFDDNVYITQNSFVQKGLCSESIIWAFTTGRASNWHPVTWLSHILDFELYGMNPGGHHLTNLLFHIINALLLFFFFRQMTGALWQSSFVAALFALHPLHVESVAWISERKDVLSTFFWILTMMSYIGYAKNRSLIRYLLTILLFILGLMTKPMLVTLPFVLLLLDYWIININKTEYHYQTIKTDPHISHFSFFTFHFQLLTEKIPFFILSAISSIATFFVQRAGGAVSSLDACPFNLRIANAIVSYSDYIKKMIFPYDLAFLYPFPKTISVWQTAAASLLIIFISFTAIWNMKKFPYIIVGWLWYMGTLVPVIGLVQVGLQSMADRYTYIPLIGLFIIIAWGIPDFIKEICSQILNFFKTQIDFIRIKIWLSILSGLLISVFMIVTWLQAHYWENSMILLANALRVTTDNKIAHYLMGNSLMSQRRFDEAIQHYSETLRIDPNFIEALNNLGVSFVHKGKTDDAIFCFQEVLRIKPELTDTKKNLEEMIIIRNERAKSGISP